MPRADETVQGVERADREGRRLGSGASRERRDYPGLRGDRMVDTEASGRLSGISRHRFGTP
ncbi:hypothetical protein GCM10010363_42840 [Streptomyces omiyaensis]|nr:hypothetical protein GCM10010363_42840 [Streptomyces omiyaensis]